MPTTRFEISNLYSIPFMSTNLSRVIKVLNYQIGSRVPYKISKTDTVLLQTTYVK